MNLEAWIRKRAPNGIFYGWWVITAGCAMTYFADAFFFRGFAVLYVPVRDGLGLSNLQTSIVFSAARGVTGMIGPIAGWLIERFGTRKLAMVGVLLSGAGYLAFSRVDNFLGFALVYFGMIALGNNLTFSHSLVAGFSMWFRRRIGLVLSLQDTSASLGGLTLIPLINILIISKGWEWTVAIFGLAYLVIVFPMTLVIRNSPESMGLLPDGDSAEEAPPAPPASQSKKAGTFALPLAVTDFSVPEAMRTRTFWLLLLGFAVWRSTSVGILVNLQPILTEWRGVGLKELGYLLSFLMGVNIAVRVIIGLAADRWPKPLILALSAAASCVSIMFLLAGSWGGSSWTIFMFLILAGVGDGAGVVSWATLADYFGRSRFATMRGIITFANTWAIIGAPIFVGWWGDRTGCGDPIAGAAGGCSYGFPMWIAVALFGCAAICYLMMRRPHRVPPTGVPPGLSSQPV